MTIAKVLMPRAGGECELCSSTTDLTAHAVGPDAVDDPDHAALLCGDCRARLAAPADADPKAWRCLAESMWSEHRPVQVLAYRVLKSLVNEPWAQDLLGQLYLDDETLAWADADARSDDDGGESGATVDAFGTPLAEGDTVTLIKDLDVKGANFTAKRGTTVKGIMLSDDTKYVEGRVNGIRIVLVAAYLKKA